MAEQMRKDLLECNVPPEMPVLSLLSTVVLPLISTTAQIRMKKNLSLLRDHIDPDAMILVACLRSRTQNPTVKDIESIGVAARLMSRINLPGGSVQVVLQGLRRVQIDEFVATNPYFRARVSCLLENEDADLELNSLIGKALSTFQKLTEVNEYYSEEYVNILRLNLDDPGWLADLICSFLNLSYDEKRRLVQAYRYTDRLKVTLQYLEETVERATVAKEIEKETQIAIEQNQREFYLRQQLEAIRRELGEEDQEEAEIRRLEERVRRSAMPKEAKQEGRDQLRRLQMISPASNEYNGIRIYLDHLLNMPWKKETTDVLNLETVRAILDRDHYNLLEAKERIVEYLAVSKLKKDLPGPILCFYGPPGTGKTSLGQSIARAMGRRFVRISLGGVRDEAEIRGHRRTYVGALPGKILQTIQKAGTRNPVLMIDEIDKLGSSPVTGDPGAALLEVLDPEQNHAFVDHFLGMPFDLSRVLFITTANVVYDISPPLRDRMELIEIPGYSEEEKLEIGKRYLIPKQFARHGLTEGLLEITDPALIQIIRQYTYEAGLRTFNRRIETIVRKVAVELTEEKADRILVGVEEVANYLGPPLAIPDAEQRAPEVGVANGLGVTSIGGSILLIEALKMPGQGHFRITGQLGEVMRESVYAAYSYVRYRADELDIDRASFDKYDIHIHFPAGSTPKDGPSAGIAIAVVLASLFSDHPVRSDVAMSGEITLRGKVLPVGGIHEKVLAAHRAGIRRVILPRGNQGDLKTLPEGVRQETEVVLVETIDAVFQETLSSIVFASQGTLEEVTQAQQVREVTLAKKGQAGK